ncbi:phospholipase A1-Igamma1, chloroplastic-like [Melia azedarach]|uniref:Phospholipase A1-Igamma1, chloroplastic-like n=1 Tax=Melia azedarach TaxID=155640 RepID=A0ACC1WVW6_MELAZ|nr:phospholipase A1-Igamma1, chloroplastic-like [Melia azedarach]
MEVSPMRQFTREKTRKTRRRVWKLKIGITWNAIKKALLITFKPHSLHLSCAPSIKQLSNTCRVHHQGLAIKPQRRPNTLKRASHDPSKTLAYLLLAPYTASDFIDYGNPMTPTKSPKENISTRWKELHGLKNWDGLLDPLHPWLRREIITYGEFVEATYDAFDFDPLSEFCGSSRYNRGKLFEELGLADHGYKVTKYIYAMSQVDLPKWFERSRLGITWSKDSNWMGFVAVSNDKETQRIGRRDIVVAWRGTVAPSEWFTDLKSKLEHFGGKNVKVQHGFHSIYTTKDEETRYNKSSASEQVMEEIKRLVKVFRERGEEVSLTLTGHSLGGALALLNAYEAATSIPDVYISVISFGAPRVGNLAFKEKLNELGVKTLRVVTKQDIVPKLPGILFNKILNKLNPITQRLNWVYRHVGTQLKLDKRISPYLKDETDFSGCHNLEIYLHLLDGFISKKSKFRWNARRDLALVNKSSDMLIEELRIPEFWYQQPHKGLVLNKFGRWVKPGREPEDVPSPFSNEVCTRLLLQ